MIGKSGQGKPKKPMRVCVLIDAWKPIWGGGQTNTYELAHYLERRGWSFDIFTRHLINTSTGRIDTSEKNTSKNIRILRSGLTTSFFNVAGRLSWLLSVIFQVWREHTKNPYILIHAHAYSAGLPSVILGKILNLPVLFTVHGSNNLDLKPNSLVGFLEKILLTKISYTQVISVSHHFLQYPNKNKNIEVIPNGVEVEAFDAIPLVKKNRKRFEMLWVGRFDKVKGLPFLLGALSQVVKHDSTIHLTLVGAGPEEVALRTLSKDLKLAPYVVFMKPLPHKNLITLYKSVNLFVLPSLSEGQPVTLLEAWAARLPVIVTSVGDNDLYVKDKVNGYVIPPGSTVYLINAILKASKNKNLKEMGKQGYDFVKKRYTWRIIAQKTESVYREIVNKYEK